MTRRLRSAVLRRLLAWHGWVAAPQSRVARIWRWAVRIASVEDTGPGTLEQFQDVLPHLPLPPLDDTLATFVASVDPLLDDGLAGGVVEHSWGDGEAAALCFEEMLLFERRMTRSLEQAPTRPTPSPRHLEFEVATGSALERPLATAVDYARRQIENVDVHARHLDGAGAASIRAVNCSPDTFMQMAFQLAYARCHPERSPCLTYETATTRLFAGGRTECVRSTSTESIAFVRAMMDPTTSRDQRERLLRKALSTHLKYRIRAKRGYGCDRHLLGLAIEAQHLGLDVELFRTIAWGLPFEVSTSQAPIRQTMGWYAEASMRGLAFLPTSPTGYGVCYAFIGTQGVNVFVSAWRRCAPTSAELFGDAIAKAVLDMLAVAQGQATP